MGAQNMTNNQQWSNQGQQGQQVNWGGNVNQNQVPDFLNQMQQHMQHSTSQNQGQHQGQHQGHNQTQNQGNPFNQFQGGFQQ